MSSMTKIVTNLVFFLEEINTVVFMPPESPPQQPDQSEIADRPLFAEVKNRRGLKVGDTIFIFRLDDSGRFEDYAPEVTISKAGTRPEYKYASYHHKSSAIGPRDIWARSREEAQAKKEEALSKSSNVMARLDTESQSEALVVREGEAATTTGIVKIVHRMRLQRVLGKAILDPEKGGIDLTDIHQAAVELTLRIGYPIVEFGISTIKEFVAEGFIELSLYQLLNQQFDQLFDQIQKMLAAVIALKPSMLEEQLKPMQDMVFKGATGLVEKFLRDNCDQIELHQLMTLDPDRTARSFIALLGDDDQLTDAFVKALGPLNEGNRGHIQEPSHQGQRLVELIREQMIQRGKRL